MGIFWHDGIVICLDFGGDYVTVNVHKNSQNSTLKRVNLLNANNSIFLKMEKTHKIEP